MRVVTAKPHHLLDIIKLYGGGREVFVPDLTYGHDFYRIGNDVLAHPTMLVEFVLDGDDICTPCRYFVDGRCTDAVASNPKRYSSKDTWNKTIDRRIMRALDIGVGDCMTVLAYCQLAKSRLSAATIATIWRERPAEETARRAELLIRGLDRYIQNKQ